MVRREYLQPVFLVQVSIHVLLHGLARQLGLSLSQIAAQLALIDLVDYVLELFER